MATRVKAAPDGRAAFAQAGSALAAMSRGLMQTGSLHVTENKMERVTLGQSDLSVSRIGLGTMTFGEQVDEAGSQALLDRAVAAGINLLDLAEMYPVPARAGTFGRTEEIVGRWLKARPGMRERLVVATKVAGPSRGYDWIRDGSQDLTGAQIVQACEDSLRRLQLDTCRGAALQRAGCRAGDVARHAGDRVGALALADGQHADRRDLGGAAR